MRYPSGFEAIAMDRKLTTILAADVVGYSALMEADEAGTHERLKAGRKENEKIALAKADAGDRS
jgi:class 3 adenylate cyclase